jgi:hypothetical protein
LNLADLLGCQSILAEENTVGVASGLYPARLLPTGELVPDPS